MTDREELEKQLDALELFPNNNLVRQLRRQIIKKLESFEKLPVTIETKPEPKEHGLKQYHRYLRLIRDNFPQYSYLEIRREFSKRKKAKKSKIPDVIWQNPSP